MRGPGRQEVVTLHAGTGNSEAAVQEALAAALELAVDPGPVTRFAANDVLIVFGLLEKSHALNREFSANSAG